MTTRLGLFVNPMSGRDVRRIAARATNMTHEAKMDMIARVAVGADRVGVDELYIFDEPFRISTQALAWVELKAKVRVFKLNLQHNQADTEQAMSILQQEGVDTVVALGGDGTHRVIVRYAPDLTLVALSTGTNNVFPVNVEPTIAGMAAGLAARGELPTDQCGVSSLCKVLHVKLNDGTSDIALIDAVLLENDFVGNFMPYDSHKIKEMVLTCALPDAIGMAPIGGFVHVIEKSDDFGLYLKLGSGHGFHAPISPGYFQPVSTQSSSKLELHQTALLNGPGVVALDGDREHWLADGESATVTLRRDGCRVLDIPAAMRYAAAESILVT